MRGGKERMFFSPPESRLFLVRCRVSLWQTTHGVALTLCRRELAWWLQHSPLISWSHIMKQGSGFLVRLLFRSGTCTTVSTSEPPDTLAGTFLWGPLVQSINGSSSVDSSLWMVAEWLILKAVGGGYRVRDVEYNWPGQIAYWLHQSLAHAWICLYIDCLGVSSRRDPPQYMSRKPPRRLVTGERQFLLPEPVTCRCH